MLRRLDIFERIIIRVLLVMMAVIVLLATIEFGWILVKDVLTPPFLLLEIDELLELFGQFLLVLIGIELLHSLKTYIMHRAIHLEAVLMVALIAVARKIIVLDPKALPEGALLGIAVMVLALALGYHLVQRSRRKDKNDDSGPETSV
ncbi:MAG: phosphate-starvation-inducible PsiE family protein [Syntrophobacteraceae bacterium]